jgi:hypothetical protein
LAWLFLACNARIPRKKIGWGGRVYVLVYSFRWVQIHAIYITYQYFSNALGSYLSLW